MLCHGTQYLCKVTKVPEEPASLVVEVSNHHNEGQNREETLADRQKMDPYLQDIIIYLSDDILPKDDIKAREIVLGRSQYELVDGVLFKVESDGHLKVVVPVSDRERVFEEVHAGEFRGHLRDAKIYSQLNRHYWWPGMRQDIVNWYHACFVCATRSIGKPIKPLLTLIL